MPKHIDDLDFSQMSPDERLSLAEQLLASVRSGTADLPATQDDLSPELWLELQRRMAAFDAGQGDSKPWPAVLASLRSKL